MLFLVRQAVWTLTGTKHDPWAFLSPGGGLVLMLTLIWLDQTLGNKVVLRLQLYPRHSLNPLIVCLENYILDDSADCVYLVQLFHLTWLDITLGTIFHSSLHPFFFKPLKRIKSHASFLNYTFFTFFLCLGNLLHWRVWQNGRRGQDRNSRGMGLILLP